MGHQFKSCKKIVNVGLDLEREVLNAFWQIVEHDDQGGVGCARNELFSKSYGAQGSNDATW